MTKSHEKIKRGHRNTCTLYLHQSFCGIWCPLKADGALVAKKTCILAVMEGYNTKLELRIDWSEMDLFGHVNNVSFFKYIQAARVNYWELVGLAQSHNNSNIGPILASTGCQFKKPLFYPGYITIKTRVGFIKNTSFSLQHIILNGNGEIVAEAEDIVVVYNFTNHEKIQIQAALLEEIEKREKGK